MEFKERLKEERKKRGLSQNELAKLVGIHVTNVSRYERGENKPTTEVLNKLANVLEVSADFLMNGSIEENATSNIADKELLQQFKRVSLLPSKDKDVVKQLIDAFLFQREVKQKLS